ncbi:MAG: NAD+ synthase [Microcystaceae cyanobacterium]
MKIAIAQLNPIIGDIDGNSQQILQAAKKAISLGANLMLTPELALCGYPPRDLLLNLDFIARMKQTLIKLSQQLPPQLSVLVGTVTLNEQAASRGEKPLYNSIVWLSGGEIKQYFHKRLLPTYDVFDEERYFEAGESSNYFMLENIKIGVTVCEDLWNDEDFWGKRQYEVNPVEELVQEKVDVIINLSASPYQVEKQQLRESMLSYSGKRHQIPMIYTNQVGGNDDLIFDGHSFAVNSQGVVVFREQGFQERLGILTFDKAQKMLTSDCLFPLPQSWESEMFDALVLGVKDYAKKCGFSQAILGLSGGIDSSLVAVIAAKALGKENVFGVLMPSPYSSDHSITDAEDLVKNIGINSTKLPIEQPMKAFDTVLDPLFKETEFGVAEENLQSRIRGNLLMAIANKFGYLLLSTGNKSEMAVGYCTLYGDMNGGLAVIADIPKTSVFSLCHWLNREQEVIPHHVLVKPPSAELKPNQVDQDSLPSYEILDAILDYLICQHQSVEDIVALGYDLEIVKKVKNLVTRAEFKRKQAPPGLKVTDRAFGTGWRMPIAKRSYI